VKLNIWPAKILTITFAVVALLAPSAAIGKSIAQWKAAIYGRSTDDSLSSSRTVGLAGFVRANHEFSESLDARILGGILLETGSSSALFTNEFEPRSRIVLQEASLRWRIIRSLSLRLGAIDQHHHQSPLLIDSGTFPAAMLALDHRYKNWFFHLDTQGAIPTSRTLSTRATGKENTPLLFTQKAIAGWDDKSSGFRAQLRATHFQFRDLTRGMARDSRFYGNEIAGIGAASRFVYKYEGFEAGPDLVVPLGSRLTWRLGGSFLQNGQGPRGHDRGIYGYTDATFKADSFSLMPRLEWYRNESDSAPAFYSSASFGHNNRTGIGGALRLALPKAGLEIEAKMKRSGLIEPRTFQRDRFNYFELTVEIPYAGF